MHELINDELPWLPVRIRNVLLNYGTYWLSDPATGQVALKRESKPITTMSQLLALTKVDLIRQPNFGLRSLATLEEALAERGLYLADASPPPLHEPGWWSAALNELT